MEDLRLSEIWIYPVKSLGGYQVKRAKVLGKGLEYDRRYMLVDENNKFMTQREYHMMSQFKISFDDQSFIVGYKGDELRLPHQPQHSNGLEKAVIWVDEVEVHVMDVSVNRWFSDRLGLNCRLVYLPDESTRWVDRSFAKAGEQVSFADGFPFLIIGQKSLDDLNSRLIVPLPMNRFRPNLVFEGGKPFYEDQWRNFRVGKNRFVAVKPCARCVLTTIDQETGKQGLEPLATLATFRRRNGNVMFGQNLLALDNYEINVGDPIQIDSFQ